MVLLIILLAHGLLMKAYSLGNFIVLLFCIDEQVSPTNEANLAVSTQAQYLNLKNIHLIL